MSKVKTAFVLSMLSVLTVSCDGLKNTVKKMFETSERARYERRFSGADSLMVNWKNEFSVAAANRLKIADGHAFTAKANPADLKALGYSLELKKGDRLVIETTTQKPGTQIFVDVFELPSGPEPAKSGILKNNTLSQVIENSGWYKIILQPEIEYDGLFSAKIYTQPSLSFPVAGKGNRDIQSFWGADRDRGARSHEGVDIFASRGTPVVAATEGFITRTGNTGLGGKQVWQRDGVLGNSLYYGHLDSIMVQGGAQVKTGDTIGLVGSTGNAEGGAPHLHFGIYAVGGAVDPYPYLRKRAVPVFKKTTVPVFKWVKAASNIRSGPGTKYETVTTLEEKTCIKVLATDGEWIHVKTSTGSEGFVKRGRLE